MAAPEALASIDRQEAKDTLLEEGARLKDQQIQKQKEERALAADLTRAGLDPNTNDTYKQIVKDLDNIQKALDALSQKWPGRKARWEKRLDNYYYNHYLDPEREELQEETSVDTETVEEEEKPSSRRERIEARKRIVEDTKDKTVGLQIDLQASLEALSKDKTMLGSALQNLVNNEYVSADLLGGTRQENALKIVFRDMPGVANKVLHMLEDETSADYQTASEFLKQTKALIDQSFNQMKISKKMTEEIQRITVEGNVANKLKDVVKRLGNDPLALAAGVGGLLAFYFLVGAETQKKVLKGMGWTVGGLGALYLGGAVFKAVNPSHRGITDYIGADLDPEVISKYKDVLLQAGFPADQMDALEDLCRISSASMDSVTAMFDAGFRDGHQTVDPRKLSGHGVNGETTGKMEGKTTFVGLKYFYGTLCANKAIEMGEPDPGSDDKARTQLGIEWAKKHFPPDWKLSTAIWELTGHTELIAAGTASIAHEKGHPGEGAIAPEGRPLEIQNDHLSELLEKEGAEIFKERVARIDSNTYNVNGFPYKYRYSNGQHVFTPSITPSTGTYKTYSVDGAQEGDPLKNSLSVLTSLAEANAKNEIETHYFNSLPTYFSKLSPALDANTLKDRVHYNEGGHYWELKPALERPSYSGLSNYERLALIPVAFVAGSNEMHLRFAPNTEMVKTGQSNKDFSSLEALVQDYELGNIFPALVARDANHLVSGDTPFKVTKVEETPSSTPDTSVVHIELDGGGSGTLSYKNNKLIGLDFTSDPSPALNKAWDKAAQAEVDDLFSQATVVDELKRVTTHFSPDRTGWGNFTDAWEATKEAFSGAVDSDVDARLNKEFIVKIRKLKEGMKQEITAQRLTNPNHTQFDKEMGIIRSRYETAVRALAKDVLREALTGDEIRALAALHVSTTSETMILSQQEISAERERGVEAIRAALEPMEAGNWILTDDQRAAIDATVNRYAGQLNTAIGALPPQGITKKAMQDAIDAVVYDASIEAGTSFGLNDREAAKKALLANLDRYTGGEQWHDASDYVVTYLQNELKWEKYAVLPAAKNMKAIIDLWDEKNGNAAPKNADDAMKFARYFIKQVESNLGLRQDYSPDNSYGTVWSVSETAFKSALPDLQKNTLDYSAWDKDPTLKTAPEISDGDIEKAMIDFEDWFDRNMDLSTWLGIEQDVPQYFKESALLRAQDIARHPDIKSTADLNTKIALLKEFVNAEKSHLYEALIRDDDGITDDPWWQDDYQNIIQTQILDNFDDAFYKGFSIGATGTASTVVRAGNAQDWGKFLDKKVTEWIR